MSASRERGLTSRRSIVRMTVLAAVGTVCSVSCGNQLPSTPTSLPLATALVPTTIPPTPTQAPTTIPPTATVVATQAPTATATPRAKVLIVLRWSPAQIDMTLTDEVGVMVDLLGKAGYQPLVATDTGNLIKGSTATLKPDLKLSDVKAADYAGVIIPCGQMSTSYIEPEAVVIVKEAAAQKKPIAAQHQGLHVLNAAGVLKAGSWPDAYQGAGVVQTGAIITSWHCPFLAEMSGLPDATAELTRTFIEALKTTA